MMKGYMNSEAIHTPITTNLATGAEERGRENTVSCQVVDERAMVGGTGGRDMADSTIIILRVETAVKIGDLLQVTSIRGQSVSRKERIVRAANVAGGFTASHIEAII